MTALVRRAFAVAWPPVTVLGVHAALTDLAGHQEWLDPVFHFSGGIAGAVALWRGMHYLTWSKPWTRRGRSVAIVLVMLAVALGWELMEFASDQLRGTHLQEGTLDTVSDVVLGVAGAVTAVWRMSRTDPRRSPRRATATPSPDPSPPP